MVNMTNYKATVRHESPREGRKFESKVSMQNILYSVKSMNIKMQEGSIIFLAVESETKPYFSKHAKGDDWIEKNTLSRLNVHKFDEALYFFRVVL